MRLSMDTKRLQISRNDKSEEMTVTTWDSELAQPGNTYHAGMRRGARTLCFHTKSRPGAAPVPMGRAADVGQPFGACWLAKEVTSTFSEA